MAYATKQDMIERFGEAELAQLTDRAAGASIDDAVLQRALDDASAEIDSYLAKRAVTPLSPVPGTVLRHACAIARWLLHKDHAPDLVAEAYKVARTWLGDVAAGRVSIDGLQTADGQASADMPIVDAPARIFGRDAMEGF